MMKFVVVAVIVLLVGSGAGGYWWWTKTAKAAADEAAKAPPTTAKVTRENIRVTVDAYGAVCSNQDVDIKCQASGLVDKLPYTDVNAHVPPGALLMHLDPKDEQPPLDLAKAVVKGDESKLQEAKDNWEIAKMSYDTTQHRAEAMLAATKASVEDARKKAKRTEELFKEKLASAEDLETANTVVATAEGAYVSAQVAIDELPQTKDAIETKAEEIEQMKWQLDQDTSKRNIAQQNLDYCTVTAPVANNPIDPPNWYVSAIGLNLNIGYLVQSGSSGFSGGTTVMTLSDLSHVFVLATVDESDCGTLMEEFNAGQELPVVMTADAFRNVYFYGKVARIATKGVNASNVVTFEFKIEVTSPNRTLLRPIMTTNVQIVVGQRQNCLAIPVQAVPRAHEDVDKMIAMYAHLATTTPGEAATKPAGKKEHGVNTTMPNLGPQNAMVEVVKADGATEEREVVLGITDGDVYEVISGLEEGETVKLKKFDADSRWRGDPDKKRSGARSK